MTSSPDARWSTTTSEGIICAQFRARASAHIAVKTGREPCSPGNGANFREGCLPFKEGEELCKMGERKKVLKSRKTSKRRPSGCVRRAGRDASSGQRNDSREIHVIRLRCGITARPPEKDGRSWPAKMRSAPLRRSCLTSCRSNRRYKTPHLCLSPPYRPVELFRFVDSRRVEEGRLRVEQLEEPGRAAVS